MSNSVTSMLLLLSLAGSVLAQRNWASASEYELYTRITAEKDAARQVELLREWETVYPNTEFRRERILTMALAYERLAQPAQAFFQATQLFKLDSSDIGGLSLIVRNGPSLQTPTPDQIRITAEAANKILLLPSRKSPEASTTNSTATVSSEDVDDLLKNLRSGKREVDLDTLRRIAAEKALAWVRSVNR